MWHMCFYQICLSLKDTKAKTVLFGFIEIVTELNVNQINYRLIKEDNFTRALCKMVR